MTFEQFQINHIDVLKEALDKLSATKGKEYAHDTDRFANFKRLTAQVNLPADKILWVYFTKHLDSIISYLKMTPEERAVAKLSEPIQGRIHDAIMYLCLLDGLWEDLKIPKVDSIFNWPHRVNINGIIYCLITTRFSNDPNKRYYNSYTGLSDDTLLSWDQVNKGIWQNERTNS